MNTFDTKIIVKYNPYTTNKNAYINADSLIRDDVQSIIELFKENKNSIELEVGNELYVYHFRIAIKRKMIKSDELKVIYVNKNSELTFTFDDETRFIYSSGEYFASEFDEVLKELM